MADQFVAEIRIVGFNFAPRGWALCNGQLLPISQNTALFSLLGTYYGGDGKSTFGLPDLQGAAPLQAGQGDGLSERFLGEMSGTETVTLLQSEIPAHNHQIPSFSTRANSTDPTANTLGSVTFANTFNTLPGTSPAMAFETLGLVGGSQPHNNMMPYLVLNFIIAMQGIFPSRG